MHNYLILVDVKKWSNRPQKPLGPVDCPMSSAGRRFMVGGWVTKQDLMLSTDRFALYPVTVKGTLEYADGNVRAEAFTTGG
jgi:hypothetical protein